MKEHLPTPGGPKVRINALMQSKILRALISGMHSIDELIRRSGGSDTCIRSYLRALRREKLVRIGGWAMAENGAAVIPLFEWAPDQRDVKQTRISAVERSRRYRAAQRARKEAEAEALAGRPQALPAHDGVRTKWVTLIDFLITAPIPPKSKQFLPGPRRVAKPSTSTSTPTEQT